MSDEVNQEVVEQQEQTDAANAAFDGAFSDEAVAQTETPAPEQNEEPNEPEAVEPEYAQITKADYEQLLSKAAKVDEIQGKIDKSFGSLGQKIKQLDEQFQARGVAGNIEVTDDVVEDFAQEWPELAPMLRKSLEKFASRIPTAGQHPAVLQESDIERLVSERAERLIEERLLTKAHKDWREVSASQEFQGWLQKQPAEFVQKLNESMDSDFVSEALTNFKTERSKAEATAQTRQKRLAAAVTPKGTGGHAGTSDSALDAFNAAFNS